MHKILSIVLFAAVLIPSGAAAADAERGRLLYESRCDGCHGTSVHQRATRKAQDFPAIRAEVVRWNKQLGGAWSREEIDDVTLYLNTRYYLFPCPQSVCGNKRSLNSAPGGLPVGG